MNTTHNTATTELDCIAAEQATALTSTENKLQRMWELRNEHRAGTNTLLAAYVGTYGKYNSGELDGLWVDLSTWTDAEEMLADLAAMHADEHDPELMFQDWDISLTGITASELGECPDADTLQILLDLLHASDYERELCLDFLGTGYRLSDFCSMLELYNKAEGLMVGCLNKNSWDPFRDWVEETFLELYGHEIPDCLTGYIDFDRMSRDWSFDYNVGELYVYQH